MDVHLLGKNFLRFPLLPACQSTLYGGQVGILNSHYENL